MNPRGAAGGGLHPTPLCPGQSSVEGPQAFSCPVYPTLQTLTTYKDRVCLPKRPQCCEKKLSPHRFPALTRSPDGTVPLLPAAPQLEPRQHLCGRCSGRNIDTCLLEASGVSWVASARRPEAAADESPTPLSRGAGGEAAHSSSPQGHPESSTAALHPAGQWRRHCSNSGVSLGELDPPPSLQTLRLRRPPLQGPRRPSSQLGVQDRAPGTSLGH